MKKDLEVTEAVFRRFKMDGSVIALFPYSIWSNYSVNCYQHVGQHGGADYQYCITATKPVLESEYADLLKELEGLGYNIKPIKKYNRKKYLNAYYESRK